MRIKLLLVSGICLILFLAGLAILAFLAQRDRDLFFILPVDSLSPRLNIEKIEDFSEKEFLLTYEILSFERVSLPHAEYPVTLVATNSRYAQILGLQMQQGSFFPRQAWTGRQKQAVLNEKAAFTIFGSNNIVGNRFRIRNETWIICGIISDGDEDRSRIYIPSSIRGGEAVSLALTSTRGLDEAYTINSIKNLGIREGDFIFFNMGTQYRLLLERTTRIPLLFLSFFFLNLLIPLAKSFKEAFISLKYDLNRFYWRDVFKKRRKSVLEFVCFSLSLLLFPALALYITLHLLSVFLLWQDIPSLTGLNFDFFSLHLERIKNFENISRIFFSLSLAFLGLFFIGFNFCLSAKKSEKRTSLNIIDVI